MQKYANLVELENCCQTHIFLQNFVLIQPRTSPLKICKILNLPILLTPSPRSDGAGVFDDAEAAGDDGRRTVPFVAEDSGVDLPLVAAARRDGF